MAKEKRLILRGIWRDVSLRYALASTFEHARCTFAPKKFPRNAQFTDDAFIAHLWRHFVADVQKLARLLGDDAVKQRREARRPLRPLIAERPKIEASREHFGVRWLCHRF